MLSRFIFIFSFFILFNESAFSKKINFEFTDKSMENFKVKDFSKKNFFSSNTLDQSELENKFYPLMDGKNLIINSTDEYLGIGMETQIPLTDKTEIELHWKINELFPEHDERLDKSDFPFILKIKNIKENLTINYVWSSNYNKGEFWFKDENTVYVALNGKNTDYSSSSKNFIYPNNDFKLFFFEKFVDQIDEIYIAIDTDTYDLETNSILEKLEVSYM